MLNYHMHMTRPPVPLTMAFPTMTEDTKSSRSEPARREKAAPSAPPSAPVVAPAALPREVGPPPVLAPQVQTHALVGGVSNELQDAINTIRLVLIVIACLLGVMVVGQLYTAMLGSRRRR